MSHIVDKYNPQTVSPKAMQNVSTVNREGILFCLHAYVPLDGTLVSAIEEAERTTDVSNKIRARS